jgi:hypothetical protein
MALDRRARLPASGIDAEILRADGSITHNSAHLALGLTSPSARGLSAV